MYREVEKESIQRIRESECLMEEDSEMSKSSKRSL